MFMELHLWSSIHTVRFSCCSGALKSFTVQALFFKTAVTSLIANSLVSSFDLSKCIIYIVLKQSVILVKLACFAKAGYHLTVFFFPTMLKLLSLENIFIFNFSGERCDSYCLLRSSSNANVCLHLTSSNILLVLTKLFKKG